MNATKCHSLGAKRNLAVELSSGEFIAHWDDDDWSAPERLSVQAQALMASGLSVTGFRRLLFWDEIRNEARRYEGSPRYVPGSTLMYRKDWWRQHQFGSVNVGEDNGFVFAAAGAGQIHVLDDERQMVATTHSANTSPRQLTAQWKPVERSEIPAAYFA
jgi:hypothetical protein